MTDSTPKTDVPFTPGYSPYEGVWNPPNRSYWQLCPNCKGACFIPYPTEDHGITSTVPNYTHRCPVCKGAGVLLVP